MNPTKTLLFAILITAAILKSSAAGDAPISLSDPASATLSTSLSDNEPPVPNYLDKNGGSPRVEPLYDPSIRSNALRKMCGGPFYDLDSSDQKLAAEFSNGLLDALVATKISDGKKLAEIYRTVLEPKIHQLKDGTESQRQLYAASEAFYEAAAYASNNDPDKGPWSDQKLNDLLRLKPPGTNRKQVLSGIMELRKDYFQLAAPDVYKMQVLRDGEK